MLTGVSFLSILICTRNIIYVDLCRDFTLLFLCLWWMTRFHSKCKEVQHSSVYSNHTTQLISQHQNIGLNQKSTQVSYSADTKITSQPLLPSALKYWTWDTPFYFHCSCIDPLTFWSAGCHCLDGLFVLSLSTFIDQIMCRNYFWFSI